ncbi:hypothetical protein OAM37_00755 [bacterium]|nr:hypothetical protein [bacterium]
MDASYVVAELFKLGRILPAASVKGRLDAPSMERWFGTMFAMQREQGYGWISSGCNKEAWDDWSK